MTFCKQLKIAVIGKNTITAWELYDKGSAVPRYEVTLSTCGIAYAVEKAAKTTWRKKFDEMVNSVLR